MSGPGLMGLGIAQAVARVGIEVLLCGRNAEAAHAGGERLENAIERQVARGRLERSRRRRDFRERRGGGRRRGARRVRNRHRVVHEDRRGENAGSASDRSRAPRRALIASNTRASRSAGSRGTLRDPSAVPRAAFLLARRTHGAGRSGEGRQTSETSVHAALAFVANRQTPVLVRDGPGFFATRVFAAYLDEALAMVSEGVAPQSIEDAAVANGRALGPLAMLDETGIAAQPATSPTGAGGRPGAAFLPAARGACACRVWPSSGAADVATAAGSSIGPPRGRERRGRGSQGAFPRGATARDPGRKAAASLRRGAGGIALPRRGRDRQRRRRRRRLGARTGLSQARRGHSSLGGGFRSRPRSSRPATHWRAT